MNKMLLDLSNHFVKLSIRSERKGDELSMRLFFAASTLVLDLKHELASR